MIDRYTGMQKGHSWGDVDYAGVSFVWIVLIVENWPIDDVDSAAREYYEFMRV